MLVYTVSSEAPEGKPKQRATPNETVLTSHQGGNAFSITGGREAETGCPSVGKLEGGGGGEVGPSAISQSVLSYFHSGSLILFPHAHVPSLRSPHPCCALSTGKPQGYP